MTVRWTAANDIEDGEEAYLWPKYLFMGANNGLTADGGQGKGYIAADLTARMTTGDDWPDGQENSHGPMDVVFFEREDPEEEIKRRLVKQGADLKRVCVVTDRLGILEANLTGFLAEIGPRFPRVGLVIFSPLNSFLPTAADWGNDVKLRQLALDPLASFAKRNRISVLSLMHPGKASDRSAQHRTLGSVAYINAPRITHAVVAWPSHEQMDGSRPSTPGRFGAIKVNGVFPPTLAFEISDAGLRWTGRTDDKMTDLFSAQFPEANGRVRKIERKLDLAMAYLREHLAPSKRMRRKLLVDGWAALGGTAITLDRAKDDLKRQGLLTTEADEWVGTWPPAPTGDGFEGSGLN